MKHFRRSPLPNEKSAGLPFCSLTKADRSQCKAKTIGFEALVKHELLEHDGEGYDPKAPTPPDYHSVDVGGNFALLSPEQRLNGHWVTL